MFAKKVVTFVHGRLLIEILCLEFLTFSQRKLILTDTAKTTLLSVAESTSMNFFKKWTRKHSDFGMPMNSHIFGVNIRGLRVEDSAPPPQLPEKRHILVLCLIRIITRVCILQIEPNTTHGISLCAELV